MSNTPLSHNGLLQGANTQYLEELYRQYLRDPSSVDASWQQFFQGYELGNGRTMLGEQESVGPNNAKVEAWINAFRRLGHLYAHLNPLKEAPELGSELKPDSHGLESVEAEDVFQPHNLSGINSAKFSEIEGLLKQTYCGFVGADFREINDVEAVVWLQEKMESNRNTPLYSSAEKKRIHEKLAYSEGFERFLQARFLGQKRFSVEGLESMIPMLDMLATDACKAGVEEITLGMAHRGRLNVLLNFMGKDKETMLREFEQSEVKSFDIDGDVKYHLGFMNESETPAGNILLNLLPNPSHLEAVNPVVEGFSRARQNQNKDTDGGKVLPLLIHGDSAIVGQGIVTETLNLANLKNYSTGGTIHIIANNQIGFTTEPVDYRSGHYSSEVAKVIRAPVFHVNADEPEAVCWTVQLAAAFRNKFKRDVVIDLIGYRRHGHNETDEPNFTQPNMYKSIKAHPTVYTKYSQYLDATGILPAAESKKIDKRIRGEFQAALDAIRSEGYKAKDHVVPKTFEKYDQYRKCDPSEMFDDAKTAVEERILKKLGSSFCSVPNDFKINPKLKRLIDTRAKLIESGEGIDWALAELLAFSSLASEGHHVRLSGQDCGRGTFSSRQIVWRDFESGKRYEPLNNLPSDQAQVDIIDSPLSEAGVVGFEFGYSVASPQALVLWEAQYGDFANGSQIIVDQFLVASEAKWDQTSSLVMLLPHGHEGSGPEHSSARPERYLQLCGSNNIQVAIPTTAAQYFHILRRQLKRGDIRKPLILMTPKSLLRSSEVTSNISELTSGTFQEILPDPKQPDPKKVKRVLFCTGKIFYELNAMREELKQNDVAIVRMEQLYPLAKIEIAEIFKQYGEAEVTWVQEEPENMGAWSFIQNRLNQIVGQNVQYIGREGSGTTAEGSGKAHAKTQDRILRQAITGKKK